MNPENRQHTSPLSIPNSPRSTTHSPKIPISSSFGAGSFSETSDKLAFSFKSRERAPSLLTERLEEELRLEQERYNQAFAEELETEHRPSLASESNSSENGEIFRNVSSDDDEHDYDELPFQFESENEEENPAQPGSHLIYIALTMLNSNHPAVSNLNYYETLLLLQQKNQDVHDELRSHFTGTGPRR